MNDISSTMDQSSLPFWVRAGSKFGALQCSWHRSTETLQAIRELLGTARLPSHIKTIAIAGSLGRREQIDGSDADLIVVRDRAPESLKDLSTDVELVYSAIESLNLPRPESKGIFSESATVEELASTESCGQIDETMPTFGKRIQLLLDSQSVYGDSNFMQLQRAVLERYGSKDVLVNSASEWTYLVNDLTRYYRCLALNAQWKPRKPGTESKFQAKFAHSRRMLYCALLLVLGESSRHTNNRFDWVASRLQLTPLERIADVIAAPADDGREISSVESRLDPALEELLTGYDNFLRIMNELATAPRSDTKQNELYAMLDHNGDDFSRRLAQVLQTYSKRWSVPMQQLLLF